MRLVIRKAIKPPIAPVTNCGQLIASIMPAASLGEIAINVNSQANSTYNNPLFPNVAKATRSAGRCLPANRNKQTYAVFPNATGIINTGNGNNC